MARPLITLFRFSLVVTTLVIFYLATTPKDLRVLTDFSDKINHLAAFLTLSLLIDFSFPQSRFGLWKISALLAYGILIECVQHFLPSRQFSLLDFLADGVAVLIYAIFQPFLKGIPLLRRRWRAQPPSGNIAPTS